MNFSPGKSVTLRLTLLFATVSSFVLLLLGVVVGQLVDRHFAELDGELLGGKLELVRDALAHVATAKDMNTLPLRLDAALVGHHGLALRIRRDDGQVIYVTANAEVLPPAAAMPQVSGPVRMNGRDGASLRVLSAATGTGIAGAAPVIVDLATDLAHHEGFMTSFHNALWLVVGFAAIASGLLGWIAARRGLAPLRDISRDVANIDAHRLDRRLPVEYIPRELAEVAHTLNDMLARLEESFRRLSDFSSDLAHELRTPVSNLLTQTQVTLSKARSAEEYRDVLASNAEEFERLSRTIADMLFLAKAEHDLIVPNRDEVDLRNEAESLIEYYDTLAEENGIRLDIEGQAMVMGDRLMFRRAIGNLLSNAFRHTPRNGSVTVRIESGNDGMAILTVANTGETIDQEHLQRLFDRFYRADPARRHDGDGAGLGLAITRSIMQAHGGDASVRSADGVTAFCLRFPVH